MGMKERLAERRARMDEIRSSAMGRKLWIDQENRYVPPFQIFGPLWYVGDTHCCPHLLDTGDGLILFDGGNCGAVAMLIQTIWEAGFDPRDVKWMILSHGHCDHLGAAMFFRKMFGTKLYIGRPDADVKREHPEWWLMQESTYMEDDVFDVDVEIEDGDVMTFGNITIEFRLVPGHTPGTLAWFYDVSDGDQTLRVGYYGGFGFNTLQKAYLLEIGDTEFKTRQTYLESLAHVRDQHVDIFLPNHVNNTDIINKQAWREAHPDEPNPHINDKLWGEYLDATRDRLLAFMADPENN